MARSFAWGTLLLVEALGCWGCTRSPITATAGPSPSLLTGRVREAGGGAPIAGAAVAEPAAFPGMGNLTYTDQSGYYRLTVRGYGVNPRYVTLASSRGVLRTSPSEFSCGGELDEGLNGCIGVVIRRFDFRRARRVRRGDLATIKQGVRERATDALVK